MAFAGPHQAGITLEPAPAAGLMASFAVLAGDRADLAGLLRDLTDEIAGLMDGTPAGGARPAPTRRPTPGSSGRTRRPTTSPWS